MAEVRIMVRVEISEFNQYDTSVEETVTDMLGGNPLFHLKEVEPLQKVALDRVNLMLRGRFGDIRERESGARDGS